MVAQLRAPCARDAVAPQQAALVHSAATPTHNDREPAAIVTAANDAYFNALVNFVGSLRYWCPECHVDVYDIGLAQAHLATIA